jgi:transposase-like protein
MLEGMIDVPLTDLMDAAACTAWLERHLHPDGLCCPRCGSTKRRFFRQFRHFVGYRCHACQRPSTILTGTIFAKSRQSPATIVMMIRGGAKGEPMAQLARELPVSRTTMHRIRQGMQDNVNETVPTAPMEGQTFEGDERYQHAGEKGEPHREPDDPPRTRANQQPGHGTSATDRPPIIHVRCRETGEVRTWVCDHADQETCRAIVRSAIPPKGPSSIVMHGRATARRIPAIRPCATAPGNGHAMPMGMGMGCAKSTVLPVKGWVSPCARFCAPFAVSIRHFWPVMSLFLI